MPVNRFRQRSMVSSLTWCFLHASATDLRCASRSIVTICASPYRLLRTGSSLSKEPSSRTQTGRRTRPGQCRGL